ncbi:mechanosensitive ion channel family protein [Sphingobium sufflavum]|uniref:mechanosensitive ion channel family protein n=1 Tax=Sphingobium sufflavum TaxID=1129547 RepID=UPI001F43F126|nr:mechanosensitive ion channel domain-containing protein [Sphingobium sufflavum]MCE7798757.1 mechanosensitive ion channel family protein [Sphingobium sufflavum]
MQSPQQAVIDIGGWLGTHWLNITIAVGAAVLIYFALNLARRTGRRLGQQSPHSLGIVAGRAIARTSHLFLMLVAARMVMGYANPPEWLSGTIRILFTIVATFQVALWAREIILGLIQRNAAPETGNDTLSNAMGIIRLLVTVGLFAIAAIVVLDNLGVNVTGLVAGLGIGGIAIGLAAQGIFSDLFAALSIIFDKPFRQGEVITYDQTTARVERIGLKSTRLRAMSGERKIISNAQLLQKEITSLQTLERRRIKFALGIIYQTPTDVAETIPAMLKQVVEGEGQVFIHAGMIGFGASSLDYELELDVPDPDTADYFMTRHRVALAILKRFNAEGIEFAYPTQTSFTAAPDGRMVLPYDDRDDARHNHRLGDAAQAGVDRKSP